MPSGGCAQVDPIDDSGYELTPSDIEFLGLGTDAVDRCRRRTAPLGMTADQFRLFRLTLLHAMWREGIVDADVRLQGSSARFFSGAHKEMPFKRRKVFSAYVDEYSVPPPLQDLEGIRAMLKKVWPKSTARPLRRPFDSLHKVRLSPYPSDYDVQISSRSGYSRIESSVRLVGVDPRSILIDNPKYQFVRKEFSEQLLYLQAWAAQWEATLGRPVNIALFDRKGPRKNRLNKKLSSHFRSSDWILHQGAIDESVIRP